MPTTSSPPRGRPGARNSTVWESGRGPVSRRGAPSALVRSVEIQTDPPNHEYGEYQDAYQIVGGGRPEAEDPPVDEAEVPDWQLGYQDHMPGYHGLPVMQPQRVMNPYGRTVITSRLPTTAGPGAPFHRSGRNGSNWRNVTQCTGNLGNHIVFINGRMQSDDCQQFPGYPTVTQVSLPRQPPSVSSAFQPVRRAAGTRSVGGSAGGGGGLYNSRALQRARAGNKYWFEEKRPTTLTPTTIQGRIMRSGVAY